ncbi:NUDIX domain-containing protein [Streptomyces sp. NPDC021224]|uniref:NUDIX domain-containing protein n=1 Tax=unclassified Streptomyces TaxID=2593676 RepID=UPI003793A714
MPQPAPHPLSPEAPYASRPPVSVGAALLLGNAAGEVLLVKPACEPRWVIPGGAMEAGETPRAAARREAREEIGLDVEPGRLLCVDFVPPAGDRPGPGVMYVFDGGRLTDAQQAAVRLPADELTDHRFVAPEALPDHLGGLLLRRVRAALAARRTGITVDLEDGRPPAESGGGPDVRR